MSPKPLKKIARNRAVVFAFLYGVLAFVAIYVITSGGMGVSFDSERYLITAYHLKQGDVGKAFQRAFPHSPMFYPLAIASIPFVEGDRGLGAARLLSLFTFAVSAAMVFLLGLRIQGKATAHLSAASLLFLAPLVYLFCHCWSETLYTMISLLFLLALIPLVKSPGRADIWRLAACGLLAGFGFVTRFIGFSLIGTGVLAILFLSNRERTSGEIKKLAVFLSASLVPMVVNLLLAFSYLGTIARESAPPRLPALDQLVAFFVTVYRDFSSFDLTFEEYVFLLAGGDGGGGVGSLGLWLKTVMLSCLMVLVIFMVRRLLFSRSFRRSVKLELVLSAYVALYGLLLVGITSVTRVDPMGSRFTAPLYPVILLLVLSLAVRTVSGFRPQRLKSLLLALLILGTSSFLAIQLISTASIYRGTSTGSFPTMGHPGNRNRASLRFLQERVASNDIVVTNIRSKLFFIWPREVPYMSGSKSELRPHLKELIAESRRLSGSVYVLHCTQDYSLHGMTDIESINEETGFFPEKRVFGNDVIYKADFGAEASPSDGAR